MTKLTGEQIKYLEDTLKHQRETERKYDEYFDKLEKAKSWREKFAVVGQEYQEIEGQNNWHESAIKDAFGIEILPELQEFYSLGIDGLDHAIYDFDYVMKLNKELREDKDHARLYLPFGHFFFFGGASNGDLFGLAYNGDGSMKREIWKWDHESDNRKEYCSFVNQHIASYFAEYGGLDEYFVRLYP